MNRPPRTSITEDEAIAIMLGLTYGPDDRPIAQVGDAEGNSATFNVRDVLDDEFDRLERECDAAVYSKEPAHIIDDKRAALHRQVATIKKADEYRKAIRDELTNGERSRLKVDGDLSNAASNYITLQSFNVWRLQRRTQELTELRSARKQSAQTPSADASQGDAPEEKGRDKMERQRKAIIAAIEELGERPLAMPEEGKGRAGMRSRVWKKVKQQKELFRTRKTFETAWQGCLDLQVIAYAEGPTPL
jgi:hypothetical protein